MKIIETYCHGKKCRESNEDFLVTTDDFVLVIDGATDKTGHIVDGMKGGRFVAKVVADLHQSGELLANIDMSDWIAAVTVKVNTELERVSWPSGIPRPAASVLAYSVHRREIFRVGDCHYRIDGALYRGGKEIDDYHGKVRADKLKACLLSGATAMELLESDPGRALILNGLKTQYRFANATAGQFAYPIINGDQVPEYLIEEPFPVSTGSIVVMTSDGFDFPRSSVAESLAAQTHSYLTDPLRLGLDGARPGTKGLAPGMAQHDDQTFVSFLA